MKKEVYKELIDDGLYEDDDVDTQKDKYLTFAVGVESYGLAIYHVTEILGIQEITKVPDMPDSVKGVINLRGKVIPVMDVRIRFNLEPVPYNDRTCIVVTDTDDLQTGLIVDTVSEVVDIPMDQIDPPPRSFSGGNHGYVQGLGKVENNVKILLDIKKTLITEGTNQSIAAA
jgi:purine-binding chemotaxis protein CheW